MQFAKESIHQVRNRNGTRSKSKYDGKFLRTFLESIIKSYRNLFLGVTLWILRFQKFVDQHMPYHSICFASGASHILCFCKFFSQTKSSRDTPQHLRNWTCVMKHSNSESLKADFRCKNCSMMTHRKVFLTPNKTLTCSQSKSWSGRSLTSWSSHGSNI